MKTTIKHIGLIAMAIITMALIACGSDDTTPETFTVTFHANGGTPEPTQQTIEKGKTVTEPQVSKPNNTLDGWFKETAFTTQWNFATDTVTANIDLYAKWKETVATPTANLAEGTYTVTQSVTLNCTTEGASIYYTLDGTAPTASSTLYSSAISISATTTLKAIAVKSEWNDSGIFTAVYTWPVGYITEFDTNAQIPIWQTEGVTDAQAQTASGNIAAGYGALPSLYKHVMKNKVKEYRIVDDVNSFDQDGAKRVIYINMNATALEIRNYLRDYVAPELGLIPNE
ncbi:hypothetical protein R84B8_00628 [Treponema sp. R8-4-B8]